MNNVKDYLHEDGDRIYYDVEIRAGEGRTAPTQLSYAEFSIERTIPILDNPKDYYLTISRFTVPVLDTPILICPISGTGYVGVGPAPPAINVTPFSVTLRYTATDFQQTVIYQTRTPNVPLPPTPGYVDVNHPYYYSVYAYNHFVDMVNQAFTNAFTLLKTAYPGAPMTEAPYFIFDPETELFSLIVPYDYVTNNVDIYLNNELQTYFVNMNYIFYGRGATNGKDFQFILSNNNNINAYAKPGGTIPAPPANPAYLRLKQDYKGLDVWNSFFDLVFTTGTLSVYREWTQNNDPQTQLPTQVSLLTDFQPLLNEAGDSRSTMAYYPQGPYRLINLTGNTPLRNFDVKIWWRDKEGRLYPLTIPYRQSVSIKFLFIKKDSFTS